MPWEDLLGDAFAEVFFRRLFTHPGAFLLWAFQGFAGSFREVVKARNGFVLFLLGVLFHAAWVLVLICLLG